MQKHVSTCERDLSYRFEKQKKRESSRLSRMKKHEELQNVIGTRESERRQRTARLLGRKQQLTTRLQREKQRAEFQEGKPQLLHFETVYDEDRKTNKIDMLANKLEVETLIQEVQTDLNVLKSILLPQSEKVLP